MSLAGLSYEFGVKKGVAKAEAAEETLAAEEARERAEALADMAVEAERRLESMTLLLADVTVACDTPRCGRYEPYPKRWARAR